MFFAYSAVSPVRQTTENDIITAEIPDLSLIFIVNKLAFGGELITDTARDHSATSRFTFAHLIIEKNIDLSFSKTLIDNMLAGTNLYFRLIVSLYENCDGSFNQCTVTSRISLDNAFVVGYNSVYNELDVAGSEFAAYEIYEFGYESVILTNPDTTESVPHIDQNFGRTQSSTTTTDSGPGRMSADSFLLQSTDWRISLGGSEFDFHAIQFSITAEISMLMSSDSGREERPQVVAYTISDIYLEKDALDSDTALLVDYVKQGNRFDAQIKIGFCDRVGVCTNQISIDLRSSSVTSILSYLEDQPKGRERMVKTEIFSLASTGFRIQIYP